jgi:hypothetical protein
LNAGCETCGGFWFDGYEIKRLEKNLKPDPAIDLLGKAIIDGINEREAWKKNVEKLEFELVNIIHNPLYLVVLIIKILINAGMVWTNRNTKEE